MIYYFGTFNPIHKGHLKIAKSVEKVYKDTVCFVPAYDSPWKPDLKENFEHRCKMITLCNGLTSNIEKFLPTPSYTYQTVQKIYETEQQKVKMIIGYDQFFSLPKWKHPEILQSLCEFIVIPRDIDLCGADLNWEFRNMVRDGWEAKLLPMPLIPASSTDIRKSIKENKKVNNLEKPVFEYIEEHGLYKD